MIFGSSGSLGGRRRRLHLPDVGLDYSIHHWLSFITFYYILSIGRSWLVLEFFFASSVANSHFSDIAENLRLTFSSFYFAAGCVRCANKNTTRTHTQTRDYVKNRRLSRELFASAEETEYETWKADRQIIDQQRIDQQRIDNDGTAAKRWIRDWDSTKGDDM